MHDESGRIKTIKGTDEPIPRDPRTLACNMRGEHEGTACPKGTPRSNIALNAANVAALGHYKICKAVSNFPDDSLVAEHAAVIAEVYDQWEQIRQMKLSTLIMKSGH